MCAPAAQPQRTASRSERPSASATANAAVKASPAPVVSTDRCGKGRDALVAELAPSLAERQHERARGAATAAASVSFGVR